MSNFYRETRNPINNKIEKAAWIDNGREYQINFPDDTSYTEEELEDAYIENGTGSNVGDK